MGRDFHRGGRGQFGGERLQAGLVAIGQREIAAACRKFKRQRAPNTAGSAGDKDDLAGETVSAGHWIGLIRYTTEFRRRSIDLIVETI